MKGVKELRKELEEYKKLYAEAILIRDKDYIQMLKERSNLLKLTEELREAIRYHHKKIKEYDEKIASIKEK